MLVRSLAVDIQQRAGSLGLRRREKVVQGTVHEEGPKESQTSGDYSEAEAREYKPGKLGVWSQTAS